MISFSDNSMAWNREFMLICWLAVVCHSSALLEGLYCGTHNCYDVLEVDRSTDAATIRKSYRKLAVQYHPDKNKDAGAREHFQLITTAYEILKDEEERANYDYMLDNPDLVYEHYYHYYRHRVAPKLDVRKVIAATLVIVSVIQYLGRWHSYNSAITYALKMPKYRMKAKEIASERGLLDRGRRKKASKEEIKAEEEATLRSVLEENIDIMGGYSKPSLWDIFIVKLALSPYYLLWYVVWRVRWWWKFTVRRDEYGDEEKPYLTRKKLKMSESLWQTLPDEKKAELVGRQLWVEENFQEYSKEQKEEMRVKMAESGRHKQYRRYMKSRGPGRMTFSE